MIPARLRLPVISDVPEKLWISENEKTGASINVPIVGTCRPTKNCIQYCYGLAGPISFGPSLARQNQNLRRFEYLATADPSEVEAEADGVYSELHKKYSYLRMFGVGDLTPGSVRFINVLAQRHPNFIVWVPTRKLDLAEQIAPVKNVFLMLSLDRTTSAVDVDKFHQFVLKRKPYAFGAYVQQTEEDVPPPWVKTIFAVHVRGYRAKWTAVNPDPRTCPATVQDGMSHKNACESCRACFTVPKISGTKPKLPSVRTANTTFTLW